MAVCLGDAFPIPRGKNEGHAIGCQPVGNPETRLIAKIDIEKRQIEGLAGENFHRLGDAWCRCYVGAQAAQDVFAIHGDDQIIFHQ